jgi:hypothetical protein
MRELFVEKKIRPRVVATYDYTDERGTLLYQVVRLDPKDFFQRKPNGKGGWTRKLGEVRRVLYKLPEVIAAKEVVIVEGEKDADTGSSLGLTATTSGAAGSWKPDFSDWLLGKRVILIIDADEAGRRHARQVAASLCGKAASLKLLELPDAKDLSEWVGHGGTREGLLDLIEKAPEWEPLRIDGGVVLDRVNVFVRRFVGVSESQSRVASLWVLHTHAFSAACATPYLAITSVEKQSGKTRLLEVLEMLVANPWFTGKVTAAVLPRKIDAESPTLLLDESDAAFHGDKEYSEALRGILNTGHRKGGKSSCCVGKGSNVEFRDFSTFCPKAISGIGKLPDTVADRAIPIRLKRAAPGEHVERFRRRDIETEAAGLREQVEAWSASIVDRLRDARPELPEALTDRQQDGAEPLLAIADAAGGEWPESARRALVSLCVEAQGSDDSIGKQLLSDIREVFESRGVDRLSSADLAADLAANETSPWGEWSHGRPLTAARVARLLRGYGIVPCSIRIGDRTPKGYLLDDFQDAFRRYLRDADTRPAFPSTQAATTQQANTGEGSRDFPGRNIGAIVADPKCKIPNENGPCCVVAVSQNPVPTVKTGIEEDL